MEVHKRVQKLKATVSLAENFPLSLQDQLMPILDLMVRCFMLMLSMLLTPPPPPCCPQALNTPHFAKVKDFISMQMPAGFPVKLGE